MSFLANTLELGFLSQHQRNSKETGHTPAIDKTGEHWSLGARFYKRLGTVTFGGLRPEYIIFAGEMKNMETIKIALFKGKAIRKTLHGNESWFVRKSGSRPRN